MNSAVILWFLMLLSVSNVFGQQAELVEFMECVELQNGANNLFINGRVYRPENRKAEGHPYFKSKDGLSGVVYINGASHIAESLNFNLATRELVLKHQRPNKTLHQIVLSDRLVDSFSIDGHVFVKQGILFPNKNTQRYLEKVYSKNGVSLYRLEKKVYLSLTNRKPYGSYTELNDSYFLIKGQEHTQISSKKDFMASYPDHKSQIKAFLKTHSIKWKTISNQQLVNLLNLCHEKI